MSDKITACTTCGSTTFSVHEVQIFPARVDEATGTLEASSSVWSDIETVACEQCGADYLASQFRKIDFC
jgi:hypothetical protein